MAKDELLMVFVKNRVLGKVKTRIAKTMGDIQAMEIYSLLLLHTISVTKGLDCDKMLFYSDSLEEEDHWKKSGFMPFVQTGNDLGERMKNAFQLAFSKNYKKIIIIGSDCFEITQDIITEGFRALDKNKVVFGPAQDGGYYLLGMTTFINELFVDKPWSTEHLLKASLLELSNKNIQSHLLPMLNDIDEEADWQAHLNKNPL
jgi:rSAM/selenodomain-associated transferase 1